MKTLIVLVLTFLSLSVNAESLGSRSLLGIEVQGFANDNSFVKGGDIGFHAAKYFDDSNVRYGLSLLTGSRNGGTLASDNLTYGGLQIGYDTTFANIFHIEGDLLFGYGYGSQKQGLVVQPQVGAGLVVVNGWRAVFMVGYLYSSSMPISGPTFGIKLDRKTFDGGYGDSR